MEEEWSGGGGRRVIKRYSLRIEGEGVTPLKLLDISTSLNCILLWYSSTICLKFITLSTHITRWVCFKFMDFFFDPQKCYRSFSVIDIFLFVFTRISLNSLFHLIVLISYKCSIFIWEKKAFLWAFRCWMEKRKFKRFFFLFFFLILLSILSL